MKTQTINLLDYRGVIESLNMVLMGYEIVSQTDTTITFNISEVCHDDICISK